MTIKEMLFEQKKKDVLNNMMGFIDVSIAILVDWLVGFG